MQLFCGINSDKSGMDYGSRLNICVYIPFVAGSKALKQMIHGNHYKICRFHSFGD